MKIWEFFKPTWGKLVLPVAVLIVMAALVAMTQSFMKSTGENACFIAQGEKELDALKPKDENNVTANDTQLFAKKLKELASEMKNRTAKYNSIETDFIGYGNNYVKRIIPFFPAPCLFEKDDYCGSYYSSEQQECLNEITKKGTGFQSVANVGQVEGYKEVNYGLIALSALCLVMAAYLVSCIVSGIYWKYKGR